MHLLRIRWGLAEAPWLVTRAMELLTHYWVTLQVYSGIFAMFPFAEFMCKITFEIYLYSDREINSTHFWKSSMGYAKCLIRTGSAWEMRHKPSYFTGKLVLYYRKRDGVKAKTITFREPKGKPVHWTSHPRIAILTELFFELCCFVRLTPAGIPLFLIRSRIETSTLHCPLGGLSFL